MALTAGALSLVSVTSTSDVVQSAVATMGTGPYTYQWYRSDVTGFTPGVGNIISGATSLTLNDSGLIPNSTVYYKVVVTDSVAATATSSQLAVLTLPTTLSQNVFQQSPIVGLVDMPYNYDTFSVRIDSTQSGSLYAGMAVKIVASTAGGVPSVVACTSKSDNCFGFINFDIKSQSFVAGQTAEVSTDGNVIWLAATAAITQGAQVCLDTLASGGVQPTGNSATVVGYALDGAAGYGSLLRVRLSTPSFATA